MEKRFDEIKNLLKTATDLEFQGKYKEAINTLEKALKINPGDGNLYNRLGDLYMKLNKTKEAISTYQKGIEAYKSDNFLRNALALCKKILRYDPANTEINFTIAQILIDLDEKSDAAMYLFSYIERQMSAGNKKDVMRAMELLKSLKLSDRTVANKMATIYDTVGEKKKADEVKQTISEESQKTIPETSLTTEEVHPVFQEPKVERAEAMPEFGKTFDTESLDRLERFTDELERVTNELRRAMRVDEVVVAVDKSLNIFSQQQKETINGLHKSLQVNMEGLKKAIGELHEGSKKNLEDVARIISGLNQSVSNINNNQRLIIQEVSKNLNTIGEQFDTALGRMLDDFRNLTACYESSSKDVCNKVDETRQVTTSLLKVSGETKSGIQTINDSLLKYFINQDNQIKRLNKFTLVMTIILGVIAILLLVLLFK